MSLARIGKFFYDLRWEILWRIHPNHRYHVIYTGLEPGYYDQDIRMLYGCFALLESYVEEHGGPESLAKHIDMLKKEAMSEKHAPKSAYEPEIETLTEALTLYNWWNATRADDIEQLGKLFLEAFPSGDDQVKNEYIDLKIKIENDEQKMLHRLMDIRPGLWV